MGGRVGTAGGLTTPQLAPSAPTDRPAERPRVPGGRPFRAGPEGGPRGVVISPVRRRIVMTGKRTKFYLGGGLFALSVAALLLTGFEEGKAYYRTVGELQAMGPAAEGRPVRVAGDVVPGSIEPRGEGRVAFTIEYDGARLPVLYTGREPLPDTLVDRAQAVATGTLLADGSFEARQVQAKCASKYDPAYETDGAERPGDPARPEPARPEVPSGTADPTGRERRSTDGI